MQSETWSVRQSTKRDRGIVSTLLHTAGKRHQHLDWREPHEILEESPFLLAFNRDELIACLACPPESAQNAWLRIFAVQQSTDLQLTWVNLWAKALDSLAKTNLHSIAALALPNWLEDLLIKSDFVETNSVVFYEWRAGRAPSADRNSGNLRGMRPDDLNEIVDLDSRAFKGLWQNSKIELLKALKQSTIATVFEREGRILGYQFSTGSAWGGHLARLAVEPEFQGEGIGTLLVSDLIRNLSRRGYHRITVNTQGDNVMSHRLYRKLGFKDTGDRYPVYEYFLRT